ncbi:MAG: radical SAM protein [Candidatus Baldrarchaeia archaeon]
MQVIKPFDPWKSPLCTCPPKYTLNPYTGCTHQCIYCYITSYIPHAFNCRPKEKLLEKVRKDIRKIDKNLVVSMSNSSDPYPSIEKDLKLTRRILELFKRHDVRVLIITKSDLVVRDVDILSSMRSSVSFTITTINEEIAAVLEPYAPSPWKRIDAIRKLVEKGVKVSVRVDPILLGLNSSEKDIEDVISAVAEAGAFHIVSSTFKPKFDSWKRFEKRFPVISRKLYKYYFKLGERVGASRYLPSSIRRKLMEKVRKIAVKHGLTFATCREGFPELHLAPSCDGSHLVPLQTHLEFIR